MNYNYYIAVPIALLYPFFFNKLANVVFDMESANKNCWDLPYKSAQGKACREERTEALAQVNTKKFVLLIIVGVLGLILSNYLSYSSSQMGIAVGSILTIATAVFMNWSNFNEVMKLAITGAAIIVLLYSPKYISKMM